MNRERAEVCPQRTQVPSPGPALGSTVGSKDRRHPAMGGGAGVGLRCSGLDSRPSSVSSHPG